MVFLDKLYDCKEAYDALFAHNCHAATIRKNNNKTKNRDLDRWRSSIRMPFEGTFSKLSKRARYRSLIKVEFQNIFQSLCHNLKKAVTILPIPTTP
jgi:IS5 family transposase